MPEWTVPGYTALKGLGSGGFGDVVLARHDASGTLVAIKYLRPDLLADPEFGVPVTMDPSAPPRRPVPERPWCALWHGVVVSVAGTGYRCSRAVG